MAYWREECNGRKSIRVECERCGASLTTAPQVEPFLSMADQGTSKTPLLDALLWLDRLGLGVVSDGQSVQTTDYRRTPIALRRLIRQCGHSLAKLLGRDRRY
jgi:hypothetical protein